MEATFVPSRLESSNAFARRRDALIRWLLARHPATAAMLVEIGLFRTQARASKRLRRLVRKRQLRIIGTVSVRDGRPGQVYCASGSVKADNLLHEVQLSRLCFKIHADQVRRGMAEVDPYLRPDAELVISGQRYFLEFDRGTMSYQSIVETRFAKYRSCRDLVLWVCETQARMEGLRRHAAGVRETALFTTLEEALCDPHAAIWIDADGERAALPRCQGDSPKGGPERVDMG